MSSACLLRLHLEAEKRITLENTMVVTAADLQPTISLWGRDCRCEPLVSYYNLHQPIKPFRIRCLRPCTLQRGWCKTIKETREAGVKT